MDRQTEQSSPSQKNVYEFNEKSQIISHYLNFKINIPFLNSKFKFFKTGSDIGLDNTGL